MYSQPIIKHVLFANITDITEESLEMGMEFLQVKETIKYHKILSTTVLIIRERPKTGQGEKDGERKGS